MIHRITCQAFKAFEKQSFELGDLSLLAGPNNSGKSTLLQAIMVWNLALTRWIEKKGPATTSKAKERTGVPITRQEFTAMPLPSMDQLWTDTRTALRANEVVEKKAGTPKVMQIILDGKAKDDGPWQFGFEFRFSSPEQIYAKPRPEDLKHLEAVKSEVSVIYVPPFSGIGVNETRHDRPYQDMLIGQGKAGDILRNLLYEVAEQEDASAWDALAQTVEEIFHYKLLKPQYEGAPYITCQYLKGIPKGKGYGGFPPLDVSTGGSGFHQILLILAFLYARPSSLILLDEPDAHLHVLLQKQAYDILRSLCHRRSSQLVIASHAEVFIDHTSPREILSFYQTPHPLAREADRDRVREALKRVTSLDLLLAEKSPGILYLEGTTDFSLLKAWARVLHHPSGSWFAERAFWHNNQGRNPKEARAHFFALRAVRPELKGLLLLDGDNRNLPTHELGGEGLALHRWERYEAESYLIHPEALRRFTADAYGDLFAQAGIDYLRNQLPPAFFSDPLGPSTFLRAEPVSKTLLPEFFQAAQTDVPKSDYFLIAEQMRPDEIPPEVTQVLDLIWKRVKKDEG